MTSPVPGRSAEFSTFLQPNSLPIQSSLAELENSIITSTPILSLENVYRDADFFKQFQACFNSKTGINHLVFLNFLKSEHFKTPLFIAIQKLLTYCPPKINYDSILNRCNQFASSYEVEQKVNDLRQYATEMSYATAEYKQFPFPLFLDFMAVSLYFRCYLRPNQALNATCFQVKCFENGLCLYSPQGEPIVTFEENLEAIFERLVLASKENYGALLPFKNLLLHMLDLFIEPSLEEEMPSSFLSLSENFLYHTINCFNASDNVFVKILGHYGLLLNLSSSPLQLIQVYLQKDMPYFDQTFALGGKYINLFEFPKLQVLKFFLKSDNLFQLKVLLPQDVNSIKIYTLFFQIWFQAAIGTASQVHCVYLQVARQMYENLPEGVKRNFLNRLLVLRLNNSWKETEEIKSLPLELLIGLYRLFFSETDLNTRSSFRLTLLLKAFYAKAKLPGDLFEELLVDFSNLISQESNHEVTRNVFRYLEPLVEQIKLQEHISKTTYDLLLMCQSFLSRYLKQMSFDYDQLIHEIQDPHYRATRQNIDLCFHFYMQFLADPHFPIKLDLNDLPLKRIILWYTNHVHALNQNPVVLLVAEYLLSSSSKLAEFEKKETEQWRRLVKQQVAKRAEDFKEQTLLKVVRKDLSETEIQKQVLQDKLKYGIFQPFLNALVTHFNFSTRTCNYQIAFKILRYLSSHLSVEKFDSIFVILYQKLHQQKNWHEILNLLLCLLNCKRQETELQERIQSSFARFSKSSLQTIDHYKSWLKFVSQIEIVRYFQSQPSLLMNMQLKLLKGLLSLDSSLKAKEEVEACFKSISLSSLTEIYSSLFELLPLIRFKVTLRQFFKQAFILAEAKKDFLALARIFTFSILNVTKAPKQSISESTWFACLEALIKDPSSNKQIVRFLQASQESHILLVFSDQNRLQQLLKTLLYHHSFPVVLEALCLIIENKLISDPLPLIKTRLSKIAEVYLYESQVKSLTEFFSRYSNLSHDYSTEQALIKLGKRLALYYKKGKKWELLGSLLIGLKSKDKSAVKSMGSSVIFKILYELIKSPHYTFKEIYDLQNLCDQSLVVEQVGLEGNKSKALNPLVLKFFYDVMQDAPSTLNQQAWSVLKEELIEGLFIAIQNPIKYIDKFVLVLMKLIEETDERIVTFFAESEVFNHMFIGKTNQNRLKDFSIALQKLFVNNFKQSKYQFYYLKCWYQIISNTEFVYSDHFIQKVYPIIMEALNQKIKNDQYNALNLYISSNSALGLCLSLFCFSELIRTCSADALKSHLSLFLAVTEHLLSYRNILNITSIVNLASSKTDHQSAFKQFLQKWQRHEIGSNAVEAYQWKIELKEQVYGFWIEILKKISFSSKGKIEQCFNGLTMLFEQDESENKLMALTLALAKIFEARKVFSNKKEESTLPSSFHTLFEAIFAYLEHLGLKRQSNGEVFLSNWLSKACIQYPAYSANLRFYYSELNVKIQACVSEGNFFYLDQVVNFWVQDSEEYIQSLPKGMGVWPNVKKCQNLILFAIENESLKEGVIINENTPIFYKLIQGIALFNDTFLEVAFSEEFFKRFESLLFATKDYIIFERRLSAFFVFFKFIVNKCEKSLKQTEFKPFLKELKKKLFDYLTKNAFSDNAQFEIFNCKIMAEVRNLKISSPVRKEGASLKLHENSLIFEDGKWGQYESYYNNIIDGLMKLGLKTSQIAQAITKKLNTTNKFFSAIEVLTQQLSVIKNHIQTQIQKVKNNPKQLREIFDHFTLYICNLAHILHDLRVRKLLTKEFFQHLSEIENITITVIFDHTPLDIALVYFSTFIQLANHWAIFDCDTKLAAKPFIDSTVHWSERFYERAAALQLPAREGYFPFAEEIVKNMLKLQKDWANQQSTS